MAESVAGVRAGDDETAEEIEAEGCEKEGLADEEEADTEGSTAGTTRETGTGGMIGAAAEELDERVE